MLVLRPSYLLGVTLICLCFSCTSGEDPSPICQTSLAVEPSSIVASPCGTTQGSFRVQVANGDGDYQYRLDGGGSVIHSSFKGLAPGLHTISVQDSRGCEGEMEVLVPSGVKMEEIFPVIQGSCAVTGCHDGRAPGRVDLRMEENIRNRASEILERTQSGNMPPSSSEQTLTEAEIALLACWANDQ